MNYYEEYWQKNSKWSPSEGGLRENEEDFFARHCKSGSTVLDYGCGDALRYGDFLVAKKVDYRGFDISKLATESAQNRGINVRLLTEDGNTTLEDEQVQTALCFEVLEHLMRPDLALMEIYRCLSKDGVLILSVPNPGFLPQRIEFFLTGFLCPGGSPMTSRISPWKDAHIRFYNLRIIKKLLLEVGFGGVKVYGCKFSIANFPYVYRHPKMRILSNIISKPFNWLGKVFPSWFSGTFYLEVTKK